MERLHVVEAGNLFAGNWIAMVNVKCDEAGTSGEILYVGKRVETFNKLGEWVLKNESDSTLIYRGTPKDRADTWEAKESDEREESEEYILDVYRTKRTPRLIAKLDGIDL